MYNFVKENQELFIALASILNTKGANMAMESNYVDGKIVYNNVPVISGYMGPEGEGFYFRANYRCFGMSELEFAQSFPINIDGYTVRMASFSEYEVEYDGDRSYPESVSFVIEKDGKNVLA
jgi:hypothetical protein